MTTKEAIVKTSFILLFAAGVGATSILNYDKPDFYQDDLDSAHKKAFRAEQNISAEFDFIDHAVACEIKSYPEYKKMDSLIRVHKTNPEEYYYLEPTIDSLAYQVDSIREAATTKRIDNSAEIENAYKKLDAAYKNVDKLTQDSIKNDSIMNQPVIQRFKNNWDKVFAQRQK